METQVALLTVEEVVPQQVLIRMELQQQIKLDLMLQQEEEREEMEEPIMEMVHLVAFLEEVEEVDIKAELGEQVQTAKSSSPGA
jgi:hypothetical protein